MPKNFFTSPLCKSRRSCRECRVSPVFRRAMVPHFDDVEDVDFECPHGVTIDEFINPAPIEPEPLEMPALLDQGKNLLAAVGRVAVAGAKKLAGEDVAILVDATETKRRLAVCSFCPFFSSADKRCSECGCFIEAKARLATEKCPQGCWDNPKKIHELARDHGPKNNFVNNVLTFQDIQRHQGELKEILPADSKLMHVLNNPKKYKQKTGCSGCGGGRLNTAMLDALVRDFRLADKEIQDKISAILGEREYVMAGNKPLTWEQLREQ